MAQRRRMEQRRQRRLQHIGRRQPLSHRQDTVDLNNNNVTVAPEIDRMAILKAFGVPAFNAYERQLQFEKQMSAKTNKQQEYNFELMRLRETVPRTAGTEASDLTIINEAVSLICDLEAQLLQKLKCQKLPFLTVQH